MGGRADGETERIPSAGAFSCAKDFAKNCHVCYRIQYRHHPPEEPRTGRWEEGILHQEVNIIG